MAERRKYSKIIQFCARKFNLNQISFLLYWVILNRRFLTFSLHSLSEGPNSSEKCLPFDVSNRLHLHMPCNFINQSQSNLNGQPQCQEFIDRISHIFYITSSKIVSSVWVILWKKNKSEKMFLESCVGQQMVQSQVNKFLKRLSVSKGPFTNDVAILNNQR